MGIIPANAPPLYNLMHTRDTDIRFKVNEILCLIPLSNIVFDLYVMNPLKIEIFKGLRNVV